MGFGEDLEKLIKRRKESDIWTDDKDIEELSKKVREEREK